MDLFSGRNAVHKAHRTGWLRAAVLGSNDGLVSTSALMVGVAAASAPTSAVLTAGIAGIAAGAMSMAAGEYISVSSQTDIQEVDRLAEAKQHEEEPELEYEELVSIYQSRGLDEILARDVATKLMANGAVDAHMRDELGYFEHHRARPVQAGVASAIAFAIGGAIPLLGLFDITGDHLIDVVIVSELGLLLTGYFSAKAAGAGMLKPMLRVLIGGTVAMAVTFLVGSLFDLAG
ncbi:MAG: VIT1/CCC1 transporter family protein [Candidatus Nanopelagicales bacterium]